MSEPSFAMKRILNLLVVNLKSKLLDETLGLNLHLNSLLSPSRGCVVSSANHSQEQKADCAVFPLVSCLTTCVEVSSKQCASEIDFTSSSLFVVTDSLCCSAILSS
jgi:hypothetical protein